MIYLKGVSKYYRPNVTALEDIELIVEENSTTALLGEEKSGKSTLLRLINRLEGPTSGQIQVGGVDVSRVNALEHRATMGFVVPGGGLIPHRTLRQNVALAPRLASFPKARRGEEISRILGVVGLDDAAAGKYPAFASPIERLQAAFARALAASPPLVLLDEPFFGLGRTERDFMRRELLRIRSLCPKTTFILATRDVVETVKLATVVVLMKEGRILETADTKTFIRSPRTKYGEALVRRHKFQIELEAVSLGDLMIRDPIFITLSQASLPVSRAVFLMRKHRIGSLLVADENRVLQGLISLEDVQDGNPERRIGDAVKTNVSALHTTDSFSDALGFFVESEEEFLPVTDESNCLQGLITRKGISKQLEKLL